MGEGMGMGMLLLLLLTSSLYLLVIVGASATGYGYSPNPNSKNTFYPAVFSVQGIVYCKSASGSGVVTPLKGGVVRITCLGVDKYGYETAPFSILSRPTDANGYFLAKLSSELLEADGVKISQCKAFLHANRLQACPYASNINLGLTGAPLSAYRALGSGSGSIRLYSVGPFVYSFNPTQRTTPSGLIQIIRSPST